MADITHDLPDFDKLWDYRDPEATEANFRELLPQARSSGDSSYLAQLLTQIARTQGLQRNFAQAHRTLDEVEGMLTDDLIAARMRYLLERGRVFNSSQQPDTARPLFLQARELGLAHGEDYFALDAIHMLGNIDPPAQGLVWNQEAIALAESSPDPRAKRWLTSLYYNTGWTLHGQGRFDEALEMFELARRRWAADGRDEDVRIARWCYARTLRSLARLEEALTEQRKLLDEYEALGKPSGYVYEELAENLLVLDRPDEARPYFALAHAELSKDPWLAANEPERLQRLNDLCAQS